MKRWYLLYCKRGEIDRAVAHLERQGVGCYQPMVKVEKIVRGKKQLRQEPLFPNYLFVHFDYQEGPSFTTVQSTRGVSKFVAFGSTPKEVAWEIIDEMRDYEQCHFDDVETSLPKCGDKVRLTAGQFAGIEAIYHEADGEKRSFLMIDLINKAVKLSVPNTDIEM